MSYWDFGLATDVYDRQGQRSVLVFLPEPKANSSDMYNALGQVALDYGHDADPRFVIISGQITYGQAQSIIGTLSTDCRGPNVPAHRPSHVADAEVISQKLAAAGFAKP